MKMKRKKMRSEQGKMRVRVALPRPTHRNAAVKHGAVNQPALVMAFTGRVELWGFAGSTREHLLEKAEHVTTLKKW